MNGLLCVPIYIDAKQPKKLQHFPKIPQNCERNPIPVQKRPGLFTLNDVKGTNPAIDYFNLANDVLLTGAVDCFPQGDF